MRTTRSANTKADRSMQTSRARPKARYACFVSLPSGNQGTFPDEEGKTMKSSGFSPVFPDETTKNEKPSGNQGVFPDGLLYLFRIELAKELIEKLTERFLINNLSINKFTFMKDEHRWGYLHIVETYIWRHSTS